MPGNGRATCTFYEELDAILGTWAASCPPVVLESGSSVAKAAEAGIMTEPEPSCPPVVLESGSSGAEAAEAGIMTEPEPLTETATVDNGDEGMFLEDL